LDLELTERCNNNCIHCYINLPADDVKTKGKELETEEIKEILREAAALGCLSVRFSGGEPLLRDDFCEVYVFARKLGLKVILFTNATLITPPLAELFNQIPPLKKIEVSVYGMTKISYEAVTKSPGSFEAAFRGINLLLKNEIPFIVKSAYLPQNKNEMVEFDRWSATIKWMEVLPSYAMFFDLRCRRDLKDKNDAIKKLRVSAREGVEIIAKRNVNYTIEMDRFCSRFTRPPGNKLLSCGAGIRSGCVDAYGNLQLCMMLRHPDTVYDLKKGTIEDALKNFFPMTRGQMALNPTYLSRCAKCFLKGLCNQCPAKSWMEHGSLDRPVAYHCEFAHAQAKYLGILKNQEKAWEVRDWKERLVRFSGGLHDEKKCQP
jgi:radical SAM protein with 4Fe4S-binding SPASM domain